MFAEVVFDGKYNMFDSNGHGSQLMKKFYCSPACEYIYTEYIYKHQNGGTEQCMSRYKLSLRDS